MLLRSRRFAPLFVTQLLGAFNDNVFKSALVVTVTLGGAARAGLSVDALVNVASALLILPFFLFSALAGQLADRLDKARLMRALKLTEVGVMGLAVLGFQLGSLPLLLGSLFLMGAQSAFFGPVKYGILPQHLGAHELVRGNGLVEMGTFVAILGGTLIGGLVIALPGVGTVALSALVLVIAAAGYVAARQVPDAPPSAPGLALDFHLARSTWRTLRLARANRPAWKAIVGASWFWFLGALLLAQLPLIAADHLGGDAHTITVLLALFTVGVGLGSLASDRLTGGRIEIGHVAPASLALTALLVDLALAIAAAPAAGHVPFRVGADLTLLGLAGGLYIVPLYALMQERSAPEERARVVAANNILNALFMVSAALFAVALRALGLSLPQLLLATAALSGVATLIALALTRDFVLRLLIAGVVRALYRVRARGLDAVPDHGPAVVVANHVSYVDALVLGGLCRRPIRFVMDHRIHDGPLRPFFRAVRAIPIAPRGEDPTRLEAALDAIDAALEDGEVVGIFPEGKLTRDGALDVFKPGVERILERRPAPVVPVGLRGLWGSFFSHAGGRPFAKWPRRVWSKIEIQAGPVMAPEDVTADGLRAAVDRLL